MDASVLNFCKALDTGSYSVLIAMLVRHGLHEWMIKLVETWWDCLVPTMVINATKSASTS